MSSTIYESFQEMMNSDSHESHLDLRHLRVFEVLLREHNLTRAADVLGVTQPALSKTLAHLRQHFGDPLFVRVGRRMEPTSKAIQLGASIRDILDRLMSLRVDHVPFDPSVAVRTFHFSVVDAGLIRLLPPLIRLLEAEAPRVHLRAQSLDLERLESSLESGKLDFAMGSFPSFTKRIRKQRLWCVTYASVARRDHPRLSGKVTLKQFVAEKHVLVSATGTGHSHLGVEHVIERAVPAENITFRVPTFMAAALAACKTDAVVTLPSGLAHELEDHLNLQVFEPPLKLPRFDIFQYWHERFHRDPGNRWIRDIFARLFRES